MKTSKAGNKEWEPGTMRLVVELLMNPVKVLKSNLGAQFTLIFLLLAVLPMVGVGIFAYSTARSALEQEVINRLTTITLLKESEVNRWINDNQDLLSALAQRPLVREYSAELITLDVRTDPAFDTLRESLLEDHFLPSLLGSSGFNDLMLIRASDGLILVSSDKSLKGKYRESTAFFIQGKQFTYVQHPVYDLSHGEAIMHISTPVKDSRGQVTAVLVGHSNLGELSWILAQRSGISQTEESYLVNISNLLMTKSRFITGAVLVKSIFSEGVSTCLTGASGSGYYDDYRGVAVVGVYRWMAELEMCIITEEDQAEAFSVINRMSSTILLAVVVTLAISLVLGLIMTRSITQPLSQLVDSSLEIGSGNLDHRIEIKGTDEISLLAQSFNQMAASLKLITASRDELDKEVTERKQAQEELIRERDKAQRYLDVAGAIFVVIDPDETVRLINKAGCDMLGADEDEIIGKNWFDNFIPERNRSEIRGVYKLLMKGDIEPTEYYENSVCAIDGSERIIAWHNTILINEEGLIQGTLSSGEDITKRRVVEGELSIKDFAFESSSSADSIGSNDGFLTHANPSFAKLWGYENVDEVIGQPILNFMADKSEALKIIESITKTGKWTGEYKALKKDGSTFIALSYANAVYDADGKQTAMYSSVVDVTERKKAEKALRDSEYMLRESQQVAKVGSYSLDIPGDFWLGSQTLDDVFGIDEKYNKNIKGWLDLVHPEDQIMMGDYFATNILKNHKPFNKEYRIIRENDQHVRWVHGYGNLELNDDGDPIKMIGTIQDITKRKIAEYEILKLNEELEVRVLQRTAQLNAANEELEAFAYSVSHDLRSPLRAIDGFSRIIMDEHLSDLPGEVQRYLGLVRDNTLDMDKLIDNLLAFSRLGRQALVRQRVFPNELVKLALKELEDDLAGRAVEKTIADLPECQADPALLKLVYINLLSNALKFTRGRDPAIIEIGCMDRGGEQIYFVKDNGVGFDMQYANKLFGVFQRLHRTEDFEGTGVGLANVQRIIHRHGGRVWAESEVDQGATFYFTCEGEIKDD